ncbi:MAG: restriction endonuclease subunit S [Candidatus Aenigmatarchaeota archaeon]
MAVTSVVTLSELEGAKRLDAEYYQPEYLKVKNQLLNTEFIYFKNLVADIIHPKEIKREYEEEKKDYLFLLAQNVRPLMLDLSEKKYLSKEKIKLIVRNKLEKGDILFVRSGNVGDITVHFGKPEKVVSSADLLVAKPKSTFKYPFYVGIFLNTKYGRNLLLRGVYSGLQPHIAPSYLNTIPIPFFPEDFIEKVENLFFQAQELLFKSESLYSQAESLLLSELSLQNFKPKEELFYEVSLSEASNVHRIDAEYFNPSYDEILKKVQQKTSLFLLKRIFDFRRGIFISPSFYSENKTERPYIRIKELSGKIGIDESKVVFIKDEYPEDELNKLQVNDLIIAIIGDTIGKVNRITNELAGGYCSNNTGRLRIKKEWQYKILPEYAEILFQSFVIQSQIEKKKAPTGQPKISDNEIKTILVPILPKQIQQKIAELVQKSHEARRKAKQLLEEAKKKVERILDYNL